MQHPYKKKKTRKLCKVLQNADILVSEQPTNILFVSNSSVMVGVSLECLEELFQEFDPKCIFIVFPTTKSYSFVQFTDVALAMKALMQLNGTKPTNFPPGNPPITLLYVNKVPAQLTLALPRNIPEGLEVLDDFIDEAQERELIKFLEERYAQCTKLKNRHVLHFGHKFNYDLNDASEPADEPIPPILRALNRKIVEALEDSQTEPDQITVNFYEPGQGIPPHFDAHSAFGERIYSLSLLSDIVMEFRDGACPSQQCDVFLPRRSLLALSGESRYRYKHCIMTRKRDVNPENNRVFARRRRISITFRTVNPRGRCQCPFVEFCDWDRDGQMRVPDSDARGKHLEREYVQKVYDRIADHFDQTRHSSWTGVARFLQTLPSQSLVLDVGCGNGKYLCREDKLNKVGCDLSASLVKIAQSKRCPVFRADALELPVRDGAFDAVISIAVIHHFSTLERRAKAISEILRVLRPGGVACVTAWAFDQTTPDGQTESVYASRMRANKSMAARNDDEEEDANYAEQGNKATFTPPAPESVNANNSKERNDKEKETNEHENTTTTAATRLRIHDGKQFAQQDMLVPWVSTGNCAESSATSPAAAHADFRYYHLFVRGELAALVRQFENGAAEGGGGGGFESELVSERYDEGNWVVVFRRRKVILDEVKNEAETEP